MTHTRNRRPNTFAILLWAVALALLVAGVVVRQLGISNYASTYANSASITDELTYYTSIIGAQYMADLGNSLLAVGALSIVIALAYQALSTVIGRSSAVLTAGRTQVGTGVGDEDGVTVELDEGENPAGEDAAEAASGSGTTGAEPSGESGTVSEHDDGPEPELEETVVEAEVVPLSEPEPEPELVAVPEPEPVAVPESEQELEAGAGSASATGSVEIEEEVALVQVDEPAHDQTAAAGAFDAGTPDGGSERETSSAVHTR